MKRFLALLLFLLPGLALGQSGFKEIRFPYGPASNPDSYDGTIRLFVDAAGNLWFDDRLNPALSLADLAAGGGEGSSTLAGLTDVELDGLDDDYILSYDEGTETWIPVSPGSLGGATDHGALTGLSDDDHTQYANLSQNETVVGAYEFEQNPTIDGNENWHAGNDSTGSGLQADGVDGVNFTFSGLSASQFMVYNGSAWANSAITDASFNTVTGTGAASADRIIAVSTAGSAWLVARTDGNSDYAGVRILRRRSDGAGSPASFYRVQSNTGSTVGIAEIGVSSAANATSATGYLEMLALSSQGFATLARNTASAAADNYLAFDMFDDAAARRTYAKISASILDPAAASIDGDLIFSIPVANTLSERLRINGFGAQVTGLATVSSSSASGDPYVGFSQAGTPRSSLGHEDTGDMLVGKSLYGGFRLQTGTGGSASTRMEISAAGVTTLHTNLTFNGSEQILKGTVHVVHLNVPGNLTVGTNKRGAPWIVPFDGLIVAARAQVLTAPTGASILVDVNKGATGSTSGTTIWSTQANRLAIAAAASAGSTTTFNTTAVTKGDWFTVDVDQVGSSVAGEHLEVVLVILKAGTY